MSRVYFAFTLVSTAFAAAPTTGVEATTESLNAAVEQGVAFLIKQQRPRGNWTEFDSEPGGTTALCALALLRCGRGKDDPSVSKALDYLLGLPAPDRTYNTSLTIIALAEADATKYRVEITRLAKALEQRQMRSESDKGGWAYKGPHGGSADGSNTHFALLALDAAAKAGVTISPQTWQAAAAWWQQPRFQATNGGYSYQPGHPSATGSMTCAAISSLRICRDRLRSTPSGASQNTIPDLAPHVEEKREQQAVQWLSDNFRADANPGQLSNNWRYYFLWALVEAAEKNGWSRLISNERLLRGKPIPSVRHDWYRAGCETLLAQTNLQDGWRGAGFVENYPEISTALALLFLAHGNKPVMIAALQADSSSPNAVIGHYPHALQNLNQRVSSRWHRGVGWQIIDFPAQNVPSTKAATAKSAPTLRELSESPILFLRGSEHTQFEAQQKQLLRDYVENGGTLLVEAAGESEEAAKFDVMFRALIPELFPGRELRELAPEHPIWFAEQSVDRSKLPQQPQATLWGLDVDFKTSVFYLPQSLSCYWELADEDSRGALPLNIREQVEQTLRLGANIAAYATSRDPKPRLDRPLLLARNRGGAAAEGAIVVPTLRSSGDEESSAAINRLLQIVACRLSMPVDYESPKVAASELNALGCAVAFIHGRDAIHFDDSEQQSLRVYLAAGGFVFAAAACSSTLFADSFLAEMKRLFPDAEVAPLPPEHPIFSNKFPGFAISKAELRRPLPLSDGSVSTRIVSQQPVVHGITVKGRLIAALVPDDISVSLARGGSLEHASYMQLDAARLGANILLYALQQNRGWLR